MMQTLYGVRTSVLSSDQTLKEFGLQKVAYSCLPTLFKMIKLRKIDVDDYSQERDTLYSLVEKIWTRPESLDNVRHSLDRWGESGTESGTYFYIEKNDEIIGLTGYFIPSLADGDFGLRHHGITVPGTGKLALDELLKYLRKFYKPDFKRLIELIPEGGEDLIKRFKSWGFKLSKEEVPDWESKRDYYKYVMVREE